VLGLGPVRPETLVFSTVEGQLLSPDNLSRDWRRVSAAKKLPRVSFHALRHTHASLLINAGIDILTISRRLGHSKPSVTLDTYGHLIAALTRQPQKPWRPYCNPNCNRDQWRVPEGSLQNAPENRDKSER
jgi:integrase